MIVEARKVWTKVKICFAMHTTRSSSFDLGKSLGWYVPFQSLNLLA
ncbi:hypothetical protein [Sporisorium scitamineum]|uniref:Uncharacterized protein n=1 Tax=Sporisorium scitamineum TaxID=49012 RepID=A0A0F7RSN7_9BASI|nr:hypothetical protein [Sporisorium scitamineum]